MCEFLWNCALVYTLLSNVTLDIVVIIEFLGIKG